MHILIRADAYSEIGVGHVMRCLALGQAYRRAGGRVTFTSAAIPPSLAQRLNNESFSQSPLDLPRTTDDIGTSRDAEATQSLIEELRPDHVVIDGYAFDDEYELLLKEITVETHSTLIAFDDDGHATHRSADMVLNQNLGADPVLYGDRPGLMLGSDYTLLRQEFLDAPSRKENASPRNLLVTLGGSDPSNTTLKVLHALSGLEKTELSVRVLAGAANPHLESLTAAVERLASANSPNARIELLLHAENMVEQYHWADIAVSAGGSTNWELSYYGIPRCSVILAENQRPIIEALAERGCVLNLGWHEVISDTAIKEAIGVLLTDLNQRTDMRAANLRCIDGKGPERVIQAIQKFKPRSGVPS